MNFIKQLDLFIEGQYLKFHYSEESKKSNNTNDHEAYYNVMFTKNSETVSCDKYQFIKTETSSQIIVRQKDNLLGDYEHIFSFSLGSEKLSIDEFTKIINSDVVKYIIYNYQLSYALAMNVDLKNNKFNIIT